MTMNKFKISLITACLVLIALCFVPPAHAQQYTFTTTTLAAAVAPPGTTGLQICFTVASGTGITGPTMGNGPFGGGQGSLGSALYIDNELMQVTSVSGTNVCVQRGQYGTMAASHVSGQLVWIAGDPTWFSQAATTVWPQGSCTVASMNAQPRIHVLDGTIWNCGSDGFWGFAGLGLDAYGSPMAKTAVTGNYTAKPWDKYLAYTSTSSGYTLTLPAASSLNGKVYVIVDESGHAASDNITVTTANGCASITANYGSCRIRSNGTAWFAF